MQGVRYVYTHFHCCRIDGSQGRVMLSKGDWGEEATADYDSIKFFNRILKVFAHPSYKDWADETLAWLTQ